MREDVAFPWARRWPDCGTLLQLVGLGMRRLILEGSINIR